MSSKIVMVLKKMELSHLSHHQPKQAQEPLKLLLKLKIKIYRLKVELQQRSQLKVLNLKLIKYHHQY